MAFISDKYAPLDNETHFLDPIQMLSLSYIYITTTSLSILGSGSVIFAAICNQKLCNANVHPIFHLSLADFFASISLFISSIFYIYRTKDIVKLCAITGGLTNAFFITTFALTILYANQVYARLRQTRTRRQSNWHESKTLNYVFITLYSLSWLLPVLLNIGFLVSVLMRSSSNGDHAQSPCYSCLALFHYREDKCKPLKDVSPGWWHARRLFFLVSLLAVMLVNTIVYLLIVREYQKHEAARGVVTSYHHTITRQIKKRAVYYQTVFVFCWLPSVVLAIIAWSPSFVMKDYFFLYVIQAFTAPLQGFLNSIVYAWIRKSFTGTLSRQPHMTSLDYEEEDPEEETLIYRRTGSARSARVLSPFRDSSHPESDSERTAHSQYSSFGKNKWPSMS